MVLLERDQELGVLSDIVGEARLGTGAAVALRGEPGAGKTALVDAACASVTGLRVLRGGCDPLSTPRPLGPFRDLAADLGPVPGDASLPLVCEAVYDALCAEPSVLVVEDLHWVDAASVEVLRFLVRRVEAMPVALVVTYRDDEIDAGHSARPLIGDFAALEGASTLELSPLHVESLAVLLRGTHLDPHRVLELTGGNPFFATEVAKEPDRPLPGSVRDAVLARAAGVGAADFEVLQLAAAAPDRLADRVLPALGVDLPTLRRLHETGLLVRDRPGLVFRHELARLAVESTIPAGGAARLHARLLAALERVGPPDPAVMTHHAVAAADVSRAFRYAREAAQEARRAASHTEAVAFLQTALAHLPTDDPPTRADLLTQLAYEQYMTNQLDSAIASITATFPLWREAGNQAGLSAAHDFCAVFEYYNARRSRAEAHAQRAASLADPDLQMEFGVARVTRAYLAFQRGEFDLAQQCSADADRIALDNTTHSSSAALALRSNIVTAAMDLANGAAGARERLVTLIEDAREHHLDEVASTGYSNLSYLDVEQRRLRAAERVLETSLALTIEREIPICNDWQTGVRARLRLLEGRWDAAVEDAAALLNGAGMPVATLWPLVVEGVVSLRRTGTPGDRLEEAWRLAERLDEPLRRLPVLSALAEQVWLTGTPDERVTDVAPVEVERSAASPLIAWAGGELAVWLQRLGIGATGGASDASQRTPSAEPYRLSLAGRHAEAAAWWRAAGAPFEEALSLADDPAPACRIQAVERLDQLGATAVADRLRRSLREVGVTQVPPRPRASTRANPAGLTNRQLDVAKLVARGCTNAEIARRLFISPKTADHHVSAVLTKLGIPNRRAVVLRAEELGLS